ncbi:BgTH12-07410 [Blumeria graminis f. sp. triticale]|uniref:BgTH12-07410 n=1 Tax=Blumeria graminis f. sp. triticale TaxID=1689686 RepID=A0A9W4GC80_BLUGR|nr:BgTH12-07410 [Blumeria graminis f. sp. triticale]
MSTVLNSHASYINTTQSEDYATPFTQDHYSYSKIMAQHTLRQMNMAQRNSRRQDSGPIATQIGVPKTWNSENS